MILSLCFWSFPFAGLSQSGNLNRRIKIPATPIRLDSLSQNVFRQAHFIFSFNSKMISPGTAIAIAGNEISLGDLLSSMQRQLNVQYSTDDNYIIFRRNNPAIKKHDFESPDQKPVTKSEWGNNILIKSNDPARRLSRDTTLTTVTISPVKNNYIAQPARLSLFRPLNIAKKLSPQITVSNNYFKKESATHHPAIGKNILSPTVFAGISGDETMYINAHINAGFRWLFGTFDWSSDFKKSIWLYGAGTSFPVGKKWLIQLSGLTGGRASNHYRIKSETDSSIVNDLSAKAFLSRINFTVKKQLMPRVQLEFGPVLNIMHTKYYLNDSLVVLRSLFPDNARPDKIYYGLKPPYSISNNIHSSQPDNKKTWIGFKIGLVYILK